MVKGPYYDKNGMKRGAWSKEEDGKLRAYVETHGHSNWRQLPKFAGLRRCGKSCRLRWVNYLRPNLKHGNYTQEEDQKIIKLHQQHGNKWSLIAGQLQGRTDNEVKNHWHSHLKKRLECNRESITEPSDISEADTTQSSESENPSLDAAPSSYNILESSQINYTEQNSTSTFTPRAECSAKYTACEIFEELSNFWTQPFIPENTYSQYNDYSPYDYAASGVGMDEYLSYFFDNTEFLCQVMQELPRDPNRDIQKQMIEENIKAKIG